MTIRKLSGLVIGCGSIGERHLFNLKKNGIKKIGVFDTDKDRLETISQKYHVERFSDLDSAFSFCPDFTFICTFPKSHLKIASLCLKNKSHFFLEKPISSEINGVSTLLKNAESKKLKVAVGYNTRFEKGLIFLKNYIKRKNFQPLAISCQFGNHIKFWRPGSDYKNHYILKKEGGIILDDSHEIDYLRWLLDDKVKSVFCQIKKSKSLKAKSDSLALIQLKFQSGIIANLTIDYLRPFYERNCHLIGESGDMKWNFSIGQKSWKNYGSKVTTNVISRGLNKKTVEKKFTSLVNDMYLDESKDFLNSIIKDKKPKIDGWDGFQTLKIALACIKSSKENRVIKIQ